MKFSDRKNFTQSPVVYGIRNNVTGEWYIGSSINMKDRLMRHLSMLRCNNHHVKRLQDAFNKYGEDNFHITVLHWFKNGETPYEMRVKEGKYIQKFNSCLCGYNTIDNITNVHAPFIKHADKVQERIERSKKKVVAINRFTGEVENIFNSVTDAARYYNGESTNISNVCKEGKLRYCYDRVFVYLENYDPNKNYIREHHCKGKRQSAEQIRERMMRASFCNKVYKYDLNNNLIAEYYSRAEAERQNGLNREFLRRRLNTNINGYIYTESKI